MDWLRYQGKARLRTLYYLLTTPDRVKSQGPEAISAAIEEYQALITEFNSAGLTISGIKPLDYKKLRESVFSGDPDLEGVLNDKSLGVRKEMHRLASEGKTPLERQRSRFFYEQHVTRYSQGSGSPVSINASDVQRQNEAYRARRQQYASDLERGRVPGQFRDEFFALGREDRHKAATGWRTSFGSERDKVLSVQQAIERGEIELRRRGATRVNHFAMLGVDKRLQQYDEPIGPVNKRWKRPQPVSVGNSAGRTYESRYAVVSATNSKGQRVFRVYFSDGTHSDALDNPDGLSELRAVVRRKGLSIRGEEFSLDRFDTEIVRARNPLSDELIEQAHVDNAGRRRLREGKALEFRRRLSWQAPWSRSHQLRVSRMYDPREKPVAPKTLSPLELRDHHQKKMLDWKTERIKKVMAGSNDGVVHMYTDLGQGAKYYRYDGRTGNLYVRTAQGSMRRIGKNVKPEKVAKFTGAKIITGKLTDHRLSQAYREYEQHHFWLFNRFDNPEMFDQANERFARVIHNMTTSQREQKAREKAIEKAKQRHARKVTGNVKTRKQKADRHRYRRLRRQFKSIQEHMESANRRVAQNRELRIKAGENVAVRTSSESYIPFSTPAPTSGRTPSFDVVTSPLGVNRDVTDAAKARDTVSRYLRRVGTAFKEADAHDVEAYMRGAAGAVSRFFDSVTLRSPITDQERRLIEIALDAGPEALGEAERRLLVQTFAYTDDLTTLRDIARGMGSQDIPDNLGSIDIMRLRRYVAGRVLGDQGAIDLQQVVHRMTTSTVSPAVHDAQIKDAKGRLARALIDMADDPMGLRDQKAGQIEDTTALRKQAGVVKLNVASVQQQVEIDGHVIGFDSVGRVSIDELIEDAEKTNLMDRKYPNLLGYTVDELKQMRGAGQTHIGLDVQLGDTVQLHILEGIGQDHLGKKINLVYHANRDQLRGLTASFADRVVSIDSETTFGTRIHDVDIPDLDNMLKDEATKEFEEFAQDVIARAREDLAKEVEKRLREAKLDPTVQPMSEAAKRQYFTRRVSEGIAREKHENMARIRSLAFVTATREKRQSIAEAGVGEYFMELGHRVLSGKGKPFAMNVDRTGKAVSFQARGFDELRRSGSLSDLMMIGKSYNEFLGNIQDLTDRGYQVVGHDIKRADFDWIRTDAFRTAMEIMDQANGSQEAIEMVDRILEYTGMLDVGDDGKLTWTRYKGLRSGHDMLKVNEHDVTVDIRAMLPGEFWKDGQYVRGYDLGDGMQYTLDDLRARVTGVVDDDFELMYGRNRDATALLKAIGDEEGIRTVDNVLKSSSQYELFGEIADDTDIDELAARIQEVLGDDAIAEITDGWKKDQIQALMRKLDEGGGASADELYILFHDYLKEKGLSGYRHQEFMDAARTHAYVNKALETVMKTGNVVIRTIEDRGTGRLDGPIEALKDLTTRLGEPVKVMVTNPKEGLKGGYRNLAIFAEKIFGDSEEVTDADKAALVTRQIAAYGREASEALLGGDIGTSLKAAAHMAGDMTEVAVTAARHRKGMAAVAAVGIAVATGTAIHNRAKQDESWRYGPSWSSKDEQEYNRRLNDVSLGKLPLEMNARRTNHHNMGPKKNDHLFKG
jgi:hypothetical protein